MYGLPKVHKENCPLRPVVSYINTPSYLMAKYFDNILKSVRNPFSNIKNSLEFFSKIKNKKIPYNHTMVSLDVNSLFTNVPLDRLLLALKKDGITYLLILSFLWINLSLVLRGSSTFAPEFRAYFWRWVAKKLHMILTQSFFYLINTLLKLKKKIFFFFFVILALTRPWIDLCRRDIVDFVARFLSFRTLKHENNHIFLLFTNPTTIRHKLFEIF